MFDDVTAGEMRVLQQLLGTNLPGAIAAMPSVDRIECYVWRAWIAARHNGHPDLSLDDVWSVPYLQLLTAQAEDGVGDDAT